MNEQQINCDSATTLPFTSNFDSDAYSHQSSSSFHHKTYKLACVMVGLPARGKTFIAQKINRYVQWLGHTTAVFNVGDLRRRVCGANVMHTFFEGSNETASSLRETLATDCLAEMLRWFEQRVPNTTSNVLVAVFDATNTTVSRRRLVYEACNGRGIDVLFVESLCTDEALIAQNILQVKLFSDDYKGSGMTPDAIVADFRRRIAHYAAVYAPIGSVPEHDESATFSYVTLLNVGRRITANAISNYFQSKLVFFLSNLHNKNRFVYLARHGESFDNVEGRIGGDSDLTAVGWAYARSLPTFLEEVRARGGDSTELNVWCSTLKRARHSVRFFTHQKVFYRKALQEINVGVCEGMTYHQVQHTYPHEFAARQRDKLRFRYKCGESYLDLIARIEPVIIEMERQGSILLVGHQAILRVIYGYFKGVALESLPLIEFPANTVIRLSSGATECVEERFEMGAELLQPS